MFYGSITEVLMLLDAPTHRGKGFDSVCHIDADLAGVKVV